MPINILNRDLLQCRIYRLLFLLFLAVFAISPITGAYTDSLCSSPVLFSDLNDADSPVGIDDLKLDDALKSLHTLKLASRQNHDNHALSPLAVAKDYLACQSIRSDHSVITLKSSQSCPLLSSDPSPPAV